MSADHRPHRSLKDREGFTLIETIIALVILTVGILAVATLSSTSIYQVRRGQDLTNAALSAQQIMEEIHGMAFDSVDVGTFGDTVTMGGIDYTVVWVVVDVSDSVGTRGAEVKDIMVYSGGGLTQANAETYQMTIFQSGPIS
jgi:prepilin-type N-terminal cleavage/methylation domain-containing protein